MITSRRRCGTTSRNRSSRLPISSDCWIEIPVTLPADRAKLATKPLPGSDTTAKTIGVVVVACCTTAAAAPYVTITSTCRRENSTAKSLTRLEVPPAQRYSTSIVSPAIQPSSRRRATKATVHEFQTVGSAPSPPMCRDVACCACATNGHAATVPDRSSTNSRRVMGFPHARVTPGSLEDSSFWIREVYRPSHSKRAANVRFGSLIGKRNTPIHLSDFFSPFQNLNSLDDTKLYAGISQAGQICFPESRGGRKISSNKS